MATTRTKDVGVTKTTLAADTYLYGDGNTDGSHKILGSDVANYVATEEGGSTLASLTAGKVPASQLPSGFDAGTYLGLWDANANSPALSNGSGTQGDYYIVGTAGTTSIDGISSWAVGDEIRANASAWEKLTPGTTAVTQGGTGATTAAGARTNLEVDSSDEVAETITNGQPSLWFDGSADYVSVADNANLSFTDGTDDLPMSVSVRVKIPDLTSTYFVAKATSSTNKEYLFGTDSNDKLQFVLRDVSAGVSVYVRSDTAITDYEGKWVHLTATYDGAGPNSTNDFPAAADGITLYVNGEAIAGTATNDGSYVGMEDGSHEVRIFRQSNYTEGESRNVEIFNTALSASDVETIYRSGVPFALDQASATAIYTSDFTSDSVDGFTAGSYATLDATATVGGDSDNLKLISDGTASSNHNMSRGVSCSESGKRFRIRGEYYMPSGQTAVDGFVIFPGGSPSVTSGTQFDSLTTDAWTPFVYENTATKTSQTLAFYLRSGGATSFDGVSGEYVAFRNIVSEDAGCTLDLDIPSTNGTTVPDRSGNGFNGTLDSMTVAGNVVGLPTTLSANNPNPTSGQALCSLGNNGTEVFKVDDSGNTVIAGDPVITNSTTPASASATGTAGTIAWDADYVYVCTATNTWKRAAISTW